METKIVENADMLAVFQRLAMHHASRHFSLSLRFADLPENIQTAIMAKLGIDG